MVRAWPSSSVGRHSGRGHDLPPRAHRPLGLGLCLVRKPKARSSWERAKRLAALGPVECSHQLPERRAVGLGVDSRKIGTFGWPVGRPGGRAARPHCPTAPLPHYPTAHGRTTHRPRPHDPTTPRPHGPTAPRPHRAPLASLPIGLWAVQLPVASAQRSPEP